MKPYEEAVKIRRICRLKNKYQRIKRDFFFFFPFADAIFVLFLFLFYIYCETVSKFNVLSNYSLKISCSWFLYSLQNLIAKPVVTNDHLFVCSKLPTTFRLLKNPRIYFQLPFVHIFNHTHSQTKNLENWVLIARKIYVVMQMIAKKIIDNHNHKKTNMLNISHGKLILRNNNSRFVLESMLKKCWTQRYTYLEMIWCKSLHFMCCGNKVIKSPGRRFFYKICLVQ